MSVCDLETSLKSLLFYAVLCYRVQLVVENSIRVVKQSFDNDVTPYYALVIAIWGSSFSPIHGSSSLSGVRLFLQFTGSDCDSVTRLTDRLDTARTLVSC